jgi:cytochrome c oxidase subunit 1
MFAAGLGGMNRRIAVYPTDLQGLNIAISCSAFILGSSFLVFIYNMVRSLANGPVAVANPWQARTLEWQTSSPPPLENFAQPVIVTAGPYEYGRSDARPHAVAVPAGAAVEEEGK